MSRFITLDWMGNGFRIEVTVTQRWTVRCIVLIHTEDSVAGRVNPLGG